MTTHNPPHLVMLARDIEAVPDLPTAVNSGIKGDPAHAKTGGYHISIEDQPNPNNYSCVRPDDKAPPGKWPRDLASAVDTSMSTTDMVKAWNRVYAVWANPNDPRRKYFNAFNGWNGTGEAERLDFVANTRTVATRDHKWHCHDETKRRYANDPEARRAKASVYRGETIAQYVLSINTTAGGSMGNQILVKDTSGMVWLCDGMWRRAIGTTPADVAGQSNSQSHQAGLLGNLGNGGNVVDFATPPEHMDGWGIDIASVGSMTPAQVQAMVDEISAAVIAADTNELTSEDLANIQASVEAGITEVLENTAVTSTIGVGTLISE